MITSRFKWFLLWWAACSLVIGTVCAASIWSLQYVKLPPWKGTIEPEEIALGEFLWVTFSLLMGPLMASSFSRPIPLELTKAPERTRDPYLETALDLGTMCVAGRLKLVFFVRHAKSSTLEEGQLFDSLDAIPDEMPDHDGNLRPVQAEQVIPLYQIT